MGYEVNVEGEITFHNIEGFRKEFEKIAQRRTSEVGMHGDFDYFFTKMWRDNLGGIDEVTNGTKIKIFREGKLWYDDKKAMEFLSKFAEGTIKFFGEDNTDWKYDIDGKGNSTKTLRGD
jgi:hypothetical protein